MEFTTGDQSTLLLTAQLLTACAMAGIIWMVQIVTYPQFLEVPESGFLNYHDRYMQRMARVVGPLMTIELVLAIAGAWYFWDSEIRWHIIISSLLVPAVWLVTFFIQVPQHAALAESGRSEATLHKIIKGNWVRVYIWTMRTAVLLVAFLKFFQDYYV